MNGRRPKLKLEITTNVNPDFSNASMCGGQKHDRGQEDKNEIARRGIRGEITEGGGKSIKG